MFSLSGPKLASKHQVAQVNMLQHQANLQKFHLQQQMRFRQFKENLKKMVPLKNAIVTPNDVVTSIIVTETKETAVPEQEPETVSVEEPEPEQEESKPESLEISQEEKPKGSYLYQKLFWWWK